MPLILIEFMEVIKVSRCLHDICLTSFFKESEDFGEIQKCAEQNSVINNYYILRYAFFKVTFILRMYAETNT